MITTNSKVIKITVDTTMAIIFKRLTLPLVRSVNNKEKFKKGTSARKKFVLILIIKAINPGKKEIKVNGVSALCASLKLLERLAIAIDKPLIRKE